MFYRTRRKVKKLIRKMGSGQKRTQVVRNAPVILTHAESWAISNGQLVKLEASYVDNRDVEC